MFGQTSVGQKMSPQSVWDRYKSEIFTCKQTPVHIYSIHTILLCVVSNIINSSIPSRILETPKDVEVLTVQLSVDNPVNLCFL